MTHDHSALLTQLDAFQGADPGSGVRRTDPRWPAGVDRRRGHSGTGCRTPRTHRGAHDLPQRDPSKTVAATSGDVEVQLPKLRSGSFLPSLRRRRRIDQALYAVGDSESFDFCREFLTGPKARDWSGGASGDLRCTCWVEICGGAAVHRCILAAVPGAFHAECTVGCVVEAFAAGDGGDQDGLRAH
jgi:hypothetical protein